MLIPHSTAKHADDIVITLAIRTPLAKGFKGGFKDTELDFLLYSLLKQVIQKSRIDPQLVEDICCGNVRLADSRCKRSRLIYISGLRWQSCLQASCCSASSWIPKHDRCLHRKPILFLGSEGYTRYCQPNRFRKH